MKKLLTILIAISLLHWILPALAESSIDDDVQSLQTAATIDEQLGTLLDISMDHAAELEAGAWNLSLTCDPAQALPEDLLPAGEMEEAELSVADFEGTKLVALYDDEGTYRLLGDFQVRIPEAMRAASLEEADAVLLLVHGTQSRDDYIGAAYNRTYDVYIYRRGARERVTVYATRTTPPVSGYGTLSGEHLSFSELWNGVRKWFFGTIEMSCPEGTAAYRITGQSCCLAGLKGEFTRYEIPAEVEGYPVVGIEDCQNDTLEELVLPEGITWIRRVGGKSMRYMNFPSTLRRIEDSLPDSLDEMNLNEGLEEIADFALLHGRGETFTLPSTLRHIGRGTLEYGVDCPFLVIPEGMTALPQYFLMNKGRVLCAFVPASITSFGSDLFDYGSILLYTPEGSPTARWAESQGYQWLPCARPEDMPQPTYAVEDGFEYAVVEGETVLTGYYGDETCVRVPDTLGGCPVAVVREQTFYNNDALRAVRFPETVRKMEVSSVGRCPSLEAVFIPASVTELHSQAVFSCGEDTVVYADDGSSAFEQPDGRSGWPRHQVWTPGAENAWFPEK